MRQHVRDLHEHVRRTGAAAERRADEWQTVLRRVGNQIPLRAISCCRLAGQLVASCHVNTLLFITAANDKGVRKGGQGGLAPQLAA